MNVTGEILRILTWGLVATLCMIAFTFTAQNLGWSRLNFPFLIGSMFTGERRAANVLGFVLYALLGWIISFFYYLLFVFTGGATPGRGLLLGLLHAALLLTVVLPLLPHFHPRVASEYDGPTTMRRLEPPGFMALHYGRRTPLIMLAGYALYGLLLGYAFS